jgi:transcriptional regulator with PAS, ATPase and Fis domain
MVSRKQFRQDLFYRLNVVPIIVPPLRERREAIFDFIAQFLNRYNAKYGLSRQMETDALDLLVSMDWPGNVRELENAVERLVAMARGDLICVEDVVRIFSNKEKKNWVGVDWKTAIRETEKRIIIEALRRHKSTRAAAKALSIDQSTVVRKMQRLGITLSDSSP